MVLVLVFFLSLAQELGVSPTVSNDGGVFFFL
jgi:hypothetical protein